MLDINSFKLEHCGNGDMESVYRVLHFENIDCNKILSCVTIYYETRNPSQVLSKNKHTGVVK